LPSWLEPEIQQSGISLTTPLTPKGKYQSLPPMLCN